MTPEDILSHPSRVLTRSQREFYFEHGYVTVEGLISREWLERLRVVSAEMVERARGLTASNDVFEEGHTAASQRLRRLTNPVSHHPAYWEFASESPMADAAADVVGPDVKFYHSKLNCKWARGGQDFKWHQDIQAWPHTNYSPVTIGLYVDDCDMSDRARLAPQRIRAEPPISSQRVLVRRCVSVPAEPAAESVRWRHRARQARALGASRSAPVRDPAGLVGGLRRPVGAPEAGDERVRPPDNVIERVVRRAHDG
jgi:hypothetical protein